MNPLDFLLAINEIEPRTVEEAMALMSTGEGETKEVIYLNPSGYHRNTLRRVLMTAAIIALLAALCAAAYAVDLLGLRALKLDPGDYPVYDYEQQPDGTWIQSETDEAVTISLTQPQEIPEDLPENIKQAIRNTQQATEEWTEFIRGDDSQFEFLRNQPEGYFRIADTDNGNGTYTIEYQRLTDGEWITIDTRTASAADVNEWKNGFAGDYEYYNVRNHIQAEKLEELAAKYDLNLRRDVHIIISGDTSRAFEEKRGLEYKPSEYDMTNREIERMLAEEICGGEVFNVSPTGYDKVYYYNEGTSAVSFYFDGEDASDGSKSCYLYNSMYSSLSWNELKDIVFDPDGYTVREYTAHDGTRITVMTNGNSVYAYAYLEKSFVTMHFWLEDGCTEAAVDRALDMINYTKLTK